MACRHTDVREFDGLRSCLGCGETQFDEDPSQDEDAGQKKEYIYTDLRCLERGKTIRLVLLQPGRHGDPIRCSLVLSGLQHSEYEAVSYTWATEDGDDEKSEPIQVDGSVLYVTKNCDAALCCLRRPQAHRRLWVDAICVNQANVSERNHQVGLMDLIYREATCVHICIQDSAQNHSECMQWLEADKNRPTLTQELFMKFSTLFSCRYFSRVWVIQEVALAKSLALHVNNEHVAITKDIVSLLHAWHGMAKLEIPAPLETMLNRNNSKDVVQQFRVSMACSCSDPRDKIYGILSLLPPHLRIMMTVNYSLDIEQVYADAVFACIIATRSLHILRFAHLDGNEPDLATACNFTTKNFDKYLQWTNPKRARLRLSLRRYIIPCHNPEADRWGFPDLGEDENSLHGERVQVSLIAGQILPCLKVCAILIDISRDLSNVGDVSRWTEFNERIHAEQRQLLQRYDQLTIQGPRDVAFFLSEIDHDYDTTSAIHVDINFFNTQYGAGFSLGKSLPGDRIFKMQGEAHLFLLRPLNGCRFRIVGACYWRQTSSPDNSIWVGIEEDAALNAAEQTQTIEIY